MKRSTRIKLYILIACVAFAIIGSSAVLFHYSYTPINPNGSKDSVVLVDIPAGSAVKEIAERLAEAKLIDKKTFLALAVDLDFLNTLGIKAKSIEGYLYPEAYRFDSSMSTRQIMKIMVGQFWKKVTPEMVKRAEILGFDLDQFVTFASIVGKERNDSKSKRKISAIFHKRLSKGMPMQSKATAVYDLEDFSGEIKQSHLKRKSPYNTYIIRGLPPGPVGNPGIDSLEATINPTRALPKEIKTLNSWSSKVLWDSFIKTERYAAFSVIINDQLPAFNFIIVGSFSEDDPQSDNFIVQYIEIINPSNKVQQRINNFRSGNYGYDKMALGFAHLVQFVDLNFDGYLDFRLLFSAGATGNNYYDSYIYDQASGKFKFDSEISELCGVTVDNDNKQIVTYGRVSYCDETMEYYNVIEDKLVLVKVENSREKKMKDGTFVCFKYTGIPHNKKIKNIKKEPLDGSLDKRARGPLGIPYVRPSATEPSPIKRPMPKENNMPLQ
jgi:cell division protein YceG involved in septum cleavage